jgi:hypothetical protein
MLDCQGIAMMATLFRTCPASSKVSRTWNSVRACKERILFANDIKQSKRSKLYISIDWKNLEKRAINSALPKSAGQCCLLPVQIWHHARPNLPRPLLPERLMFSWMDGIVHC